jgi:hypothetical protein
LVDGIKITLAKITKEVMYQYQRSCQVGEEGFGRLGRF